MILYTVSPQKYDPRFFSKELNLLTIISNSKMINNKIFHQFLNHDLIHNDKLKLV